MTAPPAPVPPERSGGDGRGDGAGDAVLAPLVEVDMVGRLTPGAMAAFADALAPTLDSGVPFAVLFDRTRLGAPTAAGREAFGRWWDAAGGAITERCVGWADLFDERRFASLKAAEASREHREKNATPYPQEIFGDRAEALTWLHPHRTAASSRTGQPS